MKKHLLLAATIIGASLVTPLSAHAFCGFYVSGATGDLYNNATKVVLMRADTRTVLSMQNDYQGPTEDFALVVPVPVVLEEEHVKTLSKEIFAKVDKMAAPRLVEYWEQDPCHRYGGLGFGGLGTRGFGRGGGGALGALAKEVDAVVVEAQFEVGEYEIVILSAKDSSALDRWLRSNKYNIPVGAGDVLRPYVEGGMYFFVAKVNADKVTFDDQGRALLSPLRFHYEDEEFRLPIRLGLLNANGPQDLIVHIVAPQQRYEVANYDNVTIPTNLDVAEEVKGNFSSFYAALFDETLEKNPGAVVTEYSWDARSCDPCPGPTLSGGDLLTLGADVLPGKPTSGMVLTRLHARYTEDTLGEDLVFKKAEPIAGGREFLDNKGVRERGAVKARINTFQGRYAIRHVWTGAIECEQFTRGRWGGPKNKPAPSKPVAAESKPSVKRDFALASVLRSHVPELDMKAKLTVRDQLKMETARTEAPKAEPASAPGTEPDGGTAKSNADAATDVTPSAASPKRGCECRSVAGAAPSGGLAAFGIVMLCVVMLRRRR